MSGLAAERDGLAAALDVVRRHRILFAHHSVGANLLAGIERLDREIGAGSLRIVSLEEAARLDGPLLAHGGGGRNGEPLSKLAFFAETLATEPRCRPELALMKLCYVDFEPRTDVDTLFAAYASVMEKLAAEHPGIRFAHVTAPLHRRQMDLESRVKRLLGREVWGDAANARRHDFNERLLERFGRETVFDLARAEATGPDGRLAAAEQRGRAIPSLHPRYTDDGGHLNALGRRHVGEAAVRFLAAALER